MSELVCARVCLFGVYDCPNKHAIFLAKNQVLLKETKMLYTSTFKRLPIESRSILTLWICLVHD